MASCGPLDVLARATLDSGDAREAAVGLTRTSSQRSSSGMTRANTLNRSSTMTSQSTRSPSACEWRKFLTLEERTSIREKIAAAYKQCESFDDLLETVAAMQEELVHISAPSRLDYFKTGCQFDRLVQNKRELMGKVEGGDQKRTKYDDDRQSSGGVTVSQDCDSQECELTQEA